MNHKKEVLVILVLIAFVYLLIYKDYRKKLLLTQNLICNGVVTEYSYGKSAGITLTYQFTLKNESIVGRRSIGIGKSKGARFVNKTFPVAVDPRDFSNNEILVLEEHFNDYKIKYPDTLNWINKLKRF